MNLRFDVVVIGGGHAGAQVAIALRQLGFAGSIAVVTEDPNPPYERPPLSKDYLAGERSFERILIRPVAFWDDKTITLITGTRIKAVDAHKRTVTATNGEAFDYVDLVWAAGGHPRRLACPGRDLLGIHVVRSRADADALIDELASTTQVVVIGGGYIGLETAAILSKGGKSVTVIESQDRVLARVAGAPLSTFYQDEHRAHGVEIRLNAAVSSIEGQNGRVVGVRLSNGEIIPADLVVVGIGIVPEVGPLEAAGANCENGVVVDEFCRTTLPNVFAVGDCALHFNAFAEGLIRLESVQNAHDQALTAAQGIMGLEKPYASVPWFWSNQYDLRLQTVGISRGFDATVTRGDPATRSFSIIYLLNRRVIALDCVNAVKDYVQGRALVSGRLSPPADHLRNTDIPIKDIVEAFSTRE